VRVQYCTRDPSLRARPGTRGKWCSIQPRRGYASRRLTGELAIRYQAGNSTAIDLYPPRLRYDHLNPETGRPPRSGDLARGSSYEPRVEIGGRFVKTNFVARLPLFLGLRSGVQYCTKAKRLPLDSTARSS
jgi:hypothetical protein